MRLSAQVPFAIPQSHAAYLADLRQCLQVLLSMDLASRHESRSDFFALNGKIGYGSESSGQELGMVHVGNSRQGKHGLKDRFLTPCDGTSFLLWLEPRE